MSTTLYLECRSHQPVITSGEVGYNTSFLPQVRSDIANRDQLVETWNSIDDVYSAWEGRRFNTISFLAHHPNCVLGIRDEYGKEYSIDGPFTEPLPGSTKMGVIREVRDVDGGVEIIFDSLTDEGKRFFGVEDR